MAHSGDQAPNDADFFLLFQVLRESRAIISEGFTRRVRGRILKLVDEGRLSQPSLMDIASTLSLDSLNIISEGIGGRPSLRDPPKRPSKGPAHPLAAEDDDADNE